ncbi:hypothetical protein A6U88_14090 [Agrobacterium sp. B131/95]|nr:hypothetical protein A6U88_14090 [Agrobacterium sp. B131/95]
MSWALRQSGRAPKTEYRGEFAGRRNGFKFGIASRLLAEGGIRCAVNDAAEIAENIILFNPIILRRPDRRSGPMQKRTIIVFSLVGG